MHIPESSAKHGILNLLKPNKALISAFFSKVAPFSFGLLKLEKSARLKILILFFPKKVFTSLILLLFF